MTNHTRFTVRCTVAERAELEVRSGGDLSKYVRATLFEGQSQAMLDLQARVEELAETVQVLNHRLAQTGKEVRELSSRQTRTGEEIREALAKAAPPPQVQPIAVPAQDNSRLKGMMLELLLLQRAVRGRPDLDRAQGTVEKQNLPVWEDKPFVPSITTGQRPQAAVERQEAPARRGVGRLFGGK
jgi:hypothetical protein